MFRGLMEDAISRSQEANICDGESSFLFYFSSGTLFKAFSILEMATREGKGT